MNRGELKRLKRWPAELTAKKTAVRATAANVNQTDLFES
jgi:hypothetical protein